MPRSPRDIVDDSALDVRSALARLLAVDRTAPIRVEHVGALTIAAVSITAVREASERTLAAWTSMHLGDRERATWAVMHVPKRRFEWLAGRVAAKWCVTARVRRDGGAIVVPRDVFVMQVADGETKGAPYVAHPCCLSLSHSAEIALAVAHRSRVGIDVERVRPVTEDLLRFSFTPEERVAIRDDRDAMIGWTSKEALLKACGVGLRASMRDIEVRLEAGSLAWDARGNRRGLDPLRRGGARGWAGVIRGYAAALVWWASP